MVSIKKHVSSAGKQMEIIRIKQNTFFGIFFNLNVLRYNKISTTCFAEEKTNSVKTQIW